MSESSPVNSETASPRLATADIQRSEKEVVGQEVEVGEVTAGSNSSTEANMVEENADNGNEEKGSINSKISVSSEANVKVEENADNRNGEEESTESESFASVEAGVKVEGAPDSEVAGAGVESIVSVSSLQKVEESEEVHGEVEGSERERSEEIGQRAEEGNEEDLSGAVAEPLEVIGGIKEVGLGMERDDSSTEGKEKGKGSVKEKEAMESCPGALRTLLAWKPQMNVGRKAPSVVMLEQWGLMMLKGKVLEIHPCPLTSMAPQMKCHLRRGRLRPLLAAYRERCI
jgi:hypothetical protein